MELSKEEREIEMLLDEGRLALKKPSKRQLATFRAAAKNTVRKDRRISVRLSERDMAGLERLAAAKGVPCQSLVSGLIHQYLEGELVRKS